MCFKYTLNETFRNIFCCSRTAMIHEYIRDVLARDETTITRCGPLPSWAPKIKTFKFFQTLRFLVSKSRLRYYSFYCKNQNSRKSKFTKMLLKNFRMSDRKVTICPGKCSISGKLTICPEKPGKINTCTEKFWYIRKKLATFPPQTLLIRCLF